MQRKTNYDLSHFNKDRLKVIKPLIEERLTVFSALPKELWQREVMFCLLTPQSDPFRAEACIIELEKLGLFKESLTETQISSVLRTPSRYIRFHRVKAVRILKFIESWPQIFEMLNSKLTPAEEREHLVGLVNGFGWKEASHALRNIGRRNLAILDRHILRILVKMKVIESIPSTINQKRYIEIERKFHLFCDFIEEEMDILDFLFWERGTGKIFK